MRITFGRFLLVAVMAAACLVPASAGAEGHARGEKAKVSTTHDTPVNINTADIKALMTLEDRKSVV